MLLQRTAFRLTFCLPIREMTLQVGIQKHPRIRKPASSNVFIKCGSAFGAGPILRPIYFFAALIFAQRVFCVAAILLRTAADILRCGVTLLLETLPAFSPEPSPNAHAWPLLSVPCLPRTFGASVVLSSLRPFVLIHRGPSRQLTAPEPVEVLKSRPELQ
jgi:hypothetical protein